jgi:predicted anti-sigma-YlaC factor YlaD
MMNADNPSASMLDCEAAARALYDYLDGRNAATPVEDLRTHFNTCRGCAKHHEFSRRVIESVSTCMPLDANLGSLREKLITTLRAEGIEVSAARE